MLPLKKDKTAAAITDKKIITNKTTKTKICISLRQWAILLSILIFIITAVITTCMVLGTLHTKQLLDLLHDDIELEEEKTIYDDGDVASINSNLARLKHSQHIVYSFGKILCIGMWLGWLNLLFSAILIYGVATMTSRYIIPWIILSSATYILVITTLTFAYFNWIPGFYVNSRVLLICVLSSSVFGQMWYIIVLYYINLKRMRCLRYSSNSPPTTVVHSYGGYTHTIQPIILNNKNLV